ncbi:MAG: 23S rRNA (guanosine(2251)-2'-O)-methyltransferase RlmB [Candidatus Kinetoplastibacterium crithidii]|nr:23S rRNA (guanosine(2251)-2'-O)-methyltransferase RlmB [Candidatus Kinetoplastibacterium crithidii]
MSSTKTIAGFHAILARLHHYPESIKTIYIDAKRNDKRSIFLLDKINNVGCKVYHVETNRLDNMTGGMRHQGVVAICSEVKLPNDIEEILDGLQEPALLLILDGVTDPHNLGACLRTANAAGVHAVIAPRNRSASINDVVYKVSSGAADITPYIMVTNLARVLRDLKDMDVCLVGTDENAANNIYTVNATKSMAWVLGSEGKGMRRLTRESCDYLVNIPMLGTVESLNVSVASAVCLYESVRQRNYYQIG